MLSLPDTNSARVFFQGGFCKRSVVKVKRRGCFVNEDLTLWQPRGLSMTLSIVFIQAYLPVISVPKGWTKTTTPPKAQPGRESSAHGCHQRNHVTIFLTTITFHGIPSFPAYGKSSVVWISQGKVNIKSEGNYIAFHRRATFLL